MVTALLHTRHAFDPKYLYMRGYMLSLYQIYVFCAYEGDSVLFIKTGLIVILANNCEPRNLYGAGFKSHDVSTGHNCRS